MNKDDFGDRMKMYEGMEATRHLMPKLPVMVRVDGKCFSKFTKGLERPYDSRMSDLMVKTTELLVQEYNALMGYTQSDEISIVLYSSTVKSQLPYDGRIQKLIGDIAAFTTLHFNKLLQYYLSQEYVKKCPRFDCRVWSVPTLEEAANAILWREQDATKNSISMAAHTYFSHKDLQGKKCNEMQDMLKDAGINWNDYPAYFKRGTFVQRKIVKRKYTGIEINKLPKMHAARNNPNLEVERKDVQTIAMPPFTKVINRVGVIFNGEVPQTEIINNA